MLIYDFIMTLRLEKNTNNKFCVKLKKSGTETFEMLGLRIWTNPVRCSEWYLHFLSRETSLEDDERSGRPSTTITTENV